MTINSEKSSDCGKSSLSFRPVSRRLFGIESHVEEAFGEETEQMQFLQILSQVPIPKFTVGIGDPSIWRSRFRSA